MIALVSEKLPELHDLCRHYHVARLALFGSATRDDFYPDKSDLDFLVEFLPLELGEGFRTYFGLREALVGLFQRQVDLVMFTAIRNPYFLAEVLATQEELYAAA